MIIFEKFIVGQFFIAMVHLLAFGHFIEIDFMAIEIRAIDTCEFGFAANRHPASPAHTGAIHHNRIEADISFNFRFAGGVNDRLHHGYRADGDNHVDFSAAVDHLLQDGRDKTVGAEGTVIRGYFQLMRGGGKFLFEYEQTFRPGADYAGDFVTRVFESLGDGKNRRNPDAAADTDAMAEFFDVRGKTERADDIGEKITFLHTVHGSRGFAHFLDDDGEYAVLAVKSADGHGDTLAGLVLAQNHELTGFGLGNQMRSLDTKLVNFLAQLLFIQNLEQRASSPIVRLNISILLIQICHDVTSIHGNHKFFICWNRQHSGG